MIIISYYTPGDYEKVMNTHLKPSLQKLGLKHYIEKIDNKGNWYQNTSYKAQFVYNCLHLFKEDVCFLDSDAIIDSYPTLLYKIPDGFACACHLLDWYLFWRKQTGNPKRELLSGTMVFKYNSEGLKLAKKYVEETKKNPKIWEQKTLQNIVETDGYKVYVLPPEYCAIKKPNGTIPDYIKTPIITHYQASRKFRAN